MTSSETLQRGPAISDRAIVFRVDDPDRSLAGVNLIQELMRPRVGPAFEFDVGQGLWKLQVPRPNADRMEYMLELIHGDGSREAVCDPANPLRAPGPFGNKSVIEFPGYRPPVWLDPTLPSSGTRFETAIPSRALRAEFRTVIWTAPGHDEEAPLPLLVAHDGPEYDEFSGLTSMLAYFIAEGALPPMRAALIAPVERDQIYSASAAYSRALTYEVLPALGRLAPTPHGRSMRIGMGASLGALAMLHVHRINPASFGALFLQSGSYFRQRFDKYETGFVRFRRISRFMGRVLTAQGWSHPIRITMTCGTIEENLANNRATKDALVRQGYEVHLHEHRDGHNWVSWRDTLDPLMVDLLKEVWG